MTQVKGLIDEKCRNAFEKWACEQGYPCPKYLDGNYRAIEWQQRWVGFRAGWEAKIQKVVDDVEKYSFVETNPANRLILTEDVLRIIGGKP